MFTGIVRELGKVEQVTHQEGVMLLDVKAPKTAPLVKVMESVAVQGVCLSVVKKRKGVLTFEAIPETQRLTNLGQVKQGDSVHLEPSLCLNDRLDGHFVYGHVDGLATLTKREETPGQLSLTLKLPKDVMRYVVPKGSLAIDGVSLTVGDKVGATTCSVYLIPETLKRTTLGKRAVGDQLNIEIDYLAKVVEKVLKHSH